MRLDFEKGLGLVGAELRGDVERELHSEVFGEIFGGTLDPPGRINDVRIKANSEMYLFDQIHFILLLRKAPVFIPSSPPTEYLGILAATATEPQSHTISHLIQE